MHVTNEPIAIVGMGCRFPSQSDNPQTYWNFLCSSGDAIVDIADALTALKIAVGMIPNPTPAQITAADVAPIVNGVPQPDGVIDIRDVVVILRKAVGLTTW